LADRVGQKRFELWFGDRIRLELHNGTLTIGVPNQFFQDWLRNKFRLHIEQACLAALGRCPSVEFRVDATLPQPEGAAEGSVAPQRQAALPTSSSPPQADSQSGPGRRPFANLDSFVTGRSNQLARTAAQLVAEQPGELSPLLIYGPTSIGKTHLLQGIWTAVKKSHRGITAVYLTAEQFTTGFLEALRGSGLPAFRQKYRGVGLLIVDDIQFLSGKHHTQVELLNTMDTLLRNGRQMVCSADRSPAELSELGLELTTRLQGGMVCRIEPPDYETRLGIAAQIARRMELRVPEEVLQFIAARLTKHARELSGALCRLQAASRAWNQPITLAMAEETLGELIRNSNRPVRLPDIEKAVCTTFGLDPASLQSSRKAKRVSHPRMLAMWLARKYTRAALSEIGEFFGRRSHSTVISAQRRVDGWLSNGTTVELADHVWNVDDAIRQVERYLQAP
jgi:chromosomal replication initiator protein